jgi:trk system potassium uptake protein TrkA
MKSFLIIGLGNFGCLLAEAFSRQSCELMVADQDEAAVNRVLPLGVSARIGDCTDPETLRSFDVAAFDACFVSVGNDFQTSLVITDHLKELGAKVVYSKASEEVQARFLRRSGADYIIYPEKEIAENLAVSACNDSIFDCMPLTGDYKIYEITAPAAWLGRSIGELDVRVNYNVSILATKTDGIVSPMPPVSYRFRTEDHLLVLSNTKDIQALVR